MKRIHVFGAAALIASCLLGVQIGTQATATRRAQTTSSTPGPYAGPRSSPIRGLTEAEITTFRSGAGMGLARPGEVNGYPGPRHVLDLADTLSLTSEQRESVQGLFGQMLAEAIPLGEEFLTRYAVLESSFRDGSITTVSLQRQATDIGQVEGALRATHLKYHLLTKALLTHEQVAAYSQLRGYTDSAPDPSPAQSPDEHQPGMHGR